MSSIANAFNEFTNAIISIFLGLFNSVLAVFQAIFALGKDIVGSLVHLVSSVVKLGVDVCQGATGFVFGTCPVSLTGMSLIDAQPTFSLLPSSEEVTTCTPRIREEGGGVR